MTHELPRWYGERQAAAQAQGWLIADNDDHGLRIEKLDDPSSVGLDAEPSFTSDAEAVAYVGLRAARGCSLARAAFEYLAAFHGVVSEV